VAAGVDAPELQAVRAARETAATATAVQRLSCMTARAFLKGVLGEATLTPHPISTAFDHPYGGNDGADARPVD
jgi:hypothetical protein